MTSKRDTYRLLLSAAALVAALSAANSAQSRPTGPALLCEVYTDSPLCEGTLPTCALCHTSTQPPNWNSYGLDLIGALAGQPFDSALAQALRDVEGGNSDGDGVANLDEILDGTGPGDASEELSPPADPVGLPNPSYDVGRYDPVWALRRVSILYCGVSPSYEEVEALRALPDEISQREVIHETLDLCLGSAFWRLSLERLADKRIRPIAAVKGFSDYDWDYRLFVYATTGGRDARDLILADYHVDEDGLGNLFEVAGVIPDDVETEGIDGQKLAPERRAGLITTEWSLIINTMFSGMPRTTAAQAYRAYLGFDIARNEGIWPAPGPLVDVDERGITQPACAVCHTTLEGLTYAFAPYHGLTGPAGSFDPQRAERLIPGWEDNQAYLFGEPVADLREWVQKAADSDAFARNLASIFFEHALDRRPQAHEFSDFEDLWRRLPETNHSVDSLLHRLVDSDSFGVP